jgi:hypothetical protein
VRNAFGDQITGRRTTDLTRALVRYRRDDEVISATQYTLYITIKPKSTYSAGPTCPATCLSRPNSLPLRHIVCRADDAITHVRPRRYSRGGAPYLFSRPRIIIQKRPTERLYRVRKTTRLIQFPLGPCQALSSARMPPREHRIVLSPRGRTVCSIAKVSRETATLNVPKPN